MSIDISQVGSTHQMIVSVLLLVVFKISFGNKAIGMGLYQTAILSCTPP